MSSLALLESNIHALRAAVAAATTVSEFQAVGHRAREILISTAQSVYDPAIHQSIGQPLSSTDAKGMLSAFVGIELPGGGNEEARRFCRAAVDLANAVQHDRAASYKDAALCAEACAAVVSIVTVLAGDRLTVPTPWEGIADGSRYFAWSGPTLHGLEDRNPIPAPNSLLKQLREDGWIPRFGTRAKLALHLSNGLHQVYETDRLVWRRELLAPGDGDQILLIGREAA